jgi:hypothetical protein
MKHGFKHRVFLVFFLQACLLLLFVRFVGLHVASVISVELTATLMLLSSLTLLLVGFLERLKGLLYPATYLIGSLLFVVGVLACTSADELSSRGGSGSSLIFLGTLALLVRPLEMLADKAKSTREGAVASETSA